MRDFIRSLDWNTVRFLVQYGNSHPGFATFAWICAQVLILLFIPILIYLWYKAEPLSHHYGNKKAAMLAVIATVFAFALKTAIAMVYFRARPFVTHPELLVSMSKIDPESFPSGHAMVAATITASFFFSGMKKLAWWLVPVMLLVAFGRVAIGVHYPTDVVAGIIIGVFSAWLLHHESSSIKRYLPNS